MKLAFPISAKNDTNSLRKHESLVLEKMIQKHHLRDTQEGELIIKRLTDLHYQVHSNLKQVVEIMPIEDPQNEKEKALLEEQENQLQELRQAVEAKKQTYLKARESMHQRKTQLDRQIDQHIERMFTEAEERIQQQNEIPIQDQECYDADDRITTLKEEFERIYDSICTGLIEVDQRNDKEINNMLKLLALRTERQEKEKAALLNLIQCQKFLQG